MSVSDVKKIPHPYEENIGFFEGLGVTLPPVIKGSEGFSCIIHAHTELVNAIRTYLEYFVPIKCMRCKHSDIVTTDPHLNQLKYHHLLSRLSLVPILQTIDWSGAKISLSVKNLSEDIMTVYMKDFTVAMPQASPKLARPLFPGDGIFAHLRPGYSLDIKGIQIITGSVASPPPDSPSVAHAMVGRAHMEVLDQPPGVSCMNSTPMKYAFSVPPQRYGSATALMSTALTLLGNKVDTIHSVCSEYKEDNIFTQQIDVIRYQNRVDVIIRDETIAFGNAILRYVYNADVSVVCFCEAMDASALGITLTIEHPSPVEVLLAATATLTTDIGSIAVVF